MTTNLNAFGGNPDRLTIAERYVPNPDISTAADRPPGPFAFKRSAEQRALSDALTAEDVRNERADNTIWDRD